MSACSSRCHFGISTKFQSHHQLQDALAVCLVKQVSLWHFNQISKSSSAAGHTGRRLVKALGLTFGLTPFLLYINDLFDDIIFNIAIYADDTTLCSKFDHASDLWQQLELGSDLESDLQDTVDWGRTQLVDFNAGKTILVSFDWSNNIGVIDVKMDVSVLEEKSFFKMLGLTFYSKLDWGFYIIFISKTASKKIGS